LCESTAGRPVARIVCFLFVHVKVFCSAHQGPCTVEEYEASCVISPSWTARLDEFGNIELSRPD
jgi:hypothetical protein